MPVKKHQMDLTSGPLWSQMILFSLPLFGSMVLQLTFHAADLVVVGRYASSDAMAAVGSTGSIMNLCVNLLLGVSGGTAVLSAQYFGAKDYHRLGTLVHTSMAFAILGGIAMAVVGQFLSYPVLKWMDSPPNVINKSTLYMCIIFAGTPFQMIYNFGSSIMRSLGDTKRPMYFLGFAGVFNVVLNVVFVVGFHMSVAGVALATIISHAISAWLVWRTLGQYDDAYRLRRKRLRLDWMELKKLLRIGIPTGLQGSFFSLSNVIIQSSINSLGSVVMAGNAATVSLEGLVYMGSFCCHHAALTFAGQNFGAKNYRRIVRSIKYASILSVLSCEFVGAVFLALGPELLSIYNGETEVIELGMERMFIAFTTYGLCGTMDSFSGALRGMGNIIFPTAIIFLSVCVMRVVWCWTVFPKVHTYGTIVWSYPISWALASIVLLGYLWYYLEFNVKQKMNGNGAVADMKP